MYSWTHTHTYKLRCLSTRCIKKWNLFLLWQTVSIWNMTALSPLPLCRSSCAIRARRMPHLHFIYKIYHTAHTANAAYVRSMYTPRWPSPCAYDKGVDYMTASSVFIISFAHCAYQHFKHLFSLTCTWPPRLASSARYCRLQITVNNRRENICPPLCRTTS